MKKILLSASIFCVLIAPSITIAQVQQDWVRKVTGPGLDRAAGIAADNSGNIWICGNNSILSSTADIYVVRYNSAGLQTASIVYNTPNNPNGNDDEAKGIAIDLLGNVYVVGTVRSSVMNTGTSDIVVIKYNSSAIQQWVTIFNTPQNWIEDANAIAVDASGNVYVTGSVVKDKPFEYDYLTLKLNSAGVVQWHSTYNGTANSIDMAYDIAVDGSGNVYVTGESQGQIGNLAVIKTYQDYATIKYNSSGVQQWVRRYNFNNGRDIAKSLALDASGNVYVTGSSGPSIDQSDCLTIKYSTDGVAQWVQRIRGTLGGRNAGNAIVVDGSGNAVVTGSFNNIEARDVLIVKYNTAGVQQWRATHNSGANRPDIGNALALDQSGNIYVAAVAGTTGPGFPNSDFITLKYSPSGAKLWVATFNGPENQDDAPTGIVVVNSSSPAVSNPLVYVYGTSANDVITIKYSQPTQRIITSSPHPASVTKEVSSNKVKVDHFPNPVNSFTNIQYDLPTQSHVRIEVYDAAGRKINTLIDAPRNAGTHMTKFNVATLAAGTYYYKFYARAGTKEFRQTKSIVIQR